MWSMLAYHTELFTDSQRDEIDSFFTAGNLTWSGAEAKLDRVVNPIFRPRGDKTTNVQPVTAEWATWMVKCAHVLAARDLCVSPAKVLAALPSVAEIIEMCMSLEMWNWWHAACGATFNLFLMVATVCEKFEDHEKVLTYTEAAMGPLTEAGSQLPSLVVLSQTLCSRAYAALGRTAEAGQAFELAVAEAHACGLARDAGAP